MIRRALVALLLTGCDAPPRTLTVLAAASLTDAFADLERAFEAEHPGVDVIVSTGGSQALATQVRHGLRADVFAGADEAHVAALAAEGLAHAPAPFATNALVLALADGVEAAGLEDLPRAERLVLGAPEVPLGRYTRALLDAAEGRHGATWRAALDARVVSLEPHARAVAAKVARGEADAAIVYATDVGPGLRAAPLPLAPVAACHHATLVDAPEPALAQAWTAFVTSPEGQAALAARGFGPVAP